jgi:hypothetical protein
MAINTNAGATAEAIALAIKAIGDALNTYVVAVETETDAWDGSNTPDALATETATLLAVVNAHVTGDIVDPYL